MHTKIQGILILHCVLRKTLGPKWDVVSRDCLVMASWSRLLPIHYSGHEIQENVMLGSWST